jgi:hypothetical protein
MSQTELIRSSCDQIKLLYLYGFEKQSRQAEYDRLTALPGHFSGRGAMSGLILLG